MAGKRKLSNALFEALATDTHESVRRQVAMNRKVPAHVRTHLAADPSPFLRHGAPAFPPEADDDQP